MLRAGAESKPAKSRRHVFSSARLRFIDPQRKGSRPGWERETFKGVYPWAVEGDPNGHDHIAHCDTCSSLAVWRRLVWSRALVLTNSFSQMRNVPSSVVSLAYHRVNCCGGDRCPAGGVNVSRAARHLGAVVRGKIQLLMGYGALGFIATDEALPTALDS